MHPVIRAFFCAAVFLGSARAAERVVDAGRQFSFEPPAGFHVAPEGTTRASILHSYAKKGVTEASPKLVFVVEEMPGTFLPSQRLSASDLPKVEGVTMSLSEIVWKRLPLDRVRDVRVGPKGTTLVSYWCQLPTTPRALQVLAMGPLDRDDEVVKTLAQVVDSFDAKIIGTQPTWVKADSEAEKVVLAGIEAINRGQGARFVTVAHAKLIMKFRDMMLTRVETAARDGSFPEEVKDHYGVATLEEFRALDPTVVARVTVEHMSEAEPAERRQQMRTAKFAVIGSRVVDENTILVAIGVDLIDAKGKTVELLSKRDGTAWKYWGYPELLRQ